MNQTKEYFLPLGFFSVNQGKIHHIDYVLDKNSEDKNPQIFFEDSECKINMNTTKYEIKKIRAAFSGLVENKNVHIYDNWMYNFRGFYFKYIHDFSWYGEEWREWQNGGRHDFLVDLVLRIMYKYGQFFFMVQPKNNDSTSFIARSEGLKFWVNNDFGLAQKHYLWLEDYSEYWWTRLNDGNSLKSGLDISYYSDDTKNPHPQDFYRWERCDKAYQKYSEIYEEEPYQDFNKYRLHHRLSGSYESDSLTRLEHFGITNAEISRRLRDSESYLFDDDGLIFKDVSDNIERVFND